MSSAWITHSQYMRARPMIRIQHRLSNERESVCNGATPRDPEPTVPENQNGRSKAPMNPEAIQSD